MPLDPKKRRKPWPYFARDARDKAAEAAVEGAKTLEPLVEGQTSDPAERERRIGKAWGLFQLIARILENVGAQTEP